VSILQAIILGIVQGLTEFLPVSRSAHLVLVPYLLGWKFSEDEAFVFGVLVQIPSLVAVIIYFWRDLWQIALGWLRGLAERKPFGSTPARLGWLLILATIPAGLFGLTVKDAVESAFSNPAMTGFFLLLTGTMLMFAERLGRRTRAIEQMTWKDALWIGVAQALSVFPGISRSGSTISGGMIRHLDRPVAARFAFLMSVPIFTAAGLLAVNDLLEMPDVGRLLLAYLPGFLASGIVSYIAIRWLIQYVAKHPLWVFAVYCFLLGGLLIFLNLI